MPTTFQVNEVEPSSAKIPPGDVKAIIRHRCGGIAPEACSDASKNVVREKMGLARPIGIDNGLVSAIHASWSDHYPLVLTPDTIWLCIAQGLAQHINLNAERLRSKFVEHEGKKELIVRRDDFVKGSPDNNWEGVFEEFSGQIRSHVGNKTHDLLTPTFSTTGPVEKAAAQVVLMDCFKQYFSYGMVCVCGIPEITLEGTVDDWKKLRDKALGLAEYDLEWWISALSPVLDQFIAAASGSVDREFWCKIYNYHGARSAYKPGPFVTGWILSLFPYTKRDDKNPHLNLWQRQDETPLTERGPGLTHGQFPPGVVTTPFTWKTIRESFPMHLYAGFMSVSQDPRSLAIRPEIGWAVADDKSFQEAKSFSLRLF